jgi:hypothetical protein
MSPDVKQDYFEKTKERKGDEKSKIRAIKKNMKRIKREREETKALNDKKIEKINEKRNMI